MLDVNRQGKYTRRRLLAAGAALLALIWIWSIASSGTSTKRTGGSSGDAAAAGVIAATNAAKRSAVSDAERVREERAIRSALAYTSYVTSGSAGKREVALTFDDGPGPFTPQVLDVLERMHVPATFFVVGRSLLDFGSYLPLELAGGFVIGNHTQNHRVLAQLSATDQSTELTDQIAGVRGYGAPTPALFRPPYGSFNRATLAITRRLKLLTVLWTIDTQDFRQPGVAAIVAKVLSGAKPGAIVLMHDAGGPRSQTVAALPLIIRALRRRRYDLVTVPRLLADDPPLMSQRQPPNLGGG